MIIHFLLTFLLLIVIVFLIGAVLAWFRARIGAPLIVDTIIWVLCAVIVLVWLIGNVGQLGLHF